MCLGLFSVRAIPVSEGIVVHDEQIELVYVYSDEGARKVLYRSLILRYTLFPLSQHQDCNWEWNEEPSWINYNAKNNASLQ